MTNVRCGVCGLGFLLVVAGSGFGAPGSGAALTLEVNLINAAGAPREVVGRAQEIAAAVFRAAGVEILWFGFSPAGSERPQSPGMLTVTINTDPVRGWSRNALGCALPLSGGGNHAGAFYSRIAKLARDPVHGFGASEAEILGYVVAHELGHLILHTNMHSPEGVMRTDWTPRDLNAMRHGNLAFSHAEVGAVRQAVSRRGNPNLAGVALWEVMGQAEELRLTIAVNNLAAVEPRTVAGAEEIATVIFQRVGVELVWKACTNSQAVPADLRLNLAAGTPEAVGRPKGGLACAAISKDGKGQLIYAFRGELEKHPVELRAILLGHAIAHEIGHLLLGPDHTRSGIMCTGWYAAEIRLASTARLEFDREQGRKIREAVAARR